MNKQNHEVFFISDVHVHHESFVCIYLNIVLADTIAEVFAHVVNKRFGQKKQIAI